MAKRGRYGAEKRQKELKKKKKREEKLARKQLKKQEAEGDPEVVQDASDEQKDIEASEDISAGTVAEGLKGETGTDDGLANKEPTKT